jgi:protein-S-isoprenylcysteine O-methyltransferase Ste14
VGALLGVLYAIVAYVLFAGTFCYTIGFIGNLAVPKSIDSGAVGPLGEALVLDLLLLGIFAAQHSIMARRSFKAWWKRIVPPAAERSTFVLAATAALALICWQWRPIPDPVIWRAGNAAAVQLLWAVYWLGWAVVLLSTFLIDHFELFGLHQALSTLFAKEIAEPKFRTPLLYRYVRHPIYLGFMLSFWAAPVMTAGRLLFAAGATGYILVGIWFEERDLIHQFGDQYRRYRKQVGMLVPGRKAG